MRETATIRPKGPFDLPLSLRAAGSFLPDQPENPSVLRWAVRLNGAAVVMEVRQTEQDPPALEVSGQARHIARLESLAAWVVQAELDLRPFYHAVAEHPVLGRVVRPLRGLKPLRPASLFEMAVIAITEQQISMVAAHHIRQRLVERFGERVDGLWAFPTPEALAGASREGLVGVGLSNRKAEYVRGLAESVTNGSLDLDALKEMPDDEARELIAAQRGFGPWSADYILVRGLGRADSLPADDLGVQSVVGRYLGSGERMTADEVRGVLAPLAPYRGLAVFYLFAHERLKVA